MFARRSLVSGISQDGRSSMRNHLSFALMISRTIGRSSFRGVCAASKNCILPPRLPHRISIIPCPIRISREAFDISCFGQSSFNGRSDGDSDEDIDGEQLVMLEDKVTGRSIQCGVDRTLDIEGECYLICYPFDDPVVFAKMSSKGELVAIEDEQLVSEMFDTAHAVLAEDDIVLVNSAFVLTVEGDFDDVSDDEDDTALNANARKKHLRHDESRVVDEDVDPTGENVEIIGEFLYRGEQIMVGKPLDATVLVARNVGQELVVLTGDELERMTPLIEANFGPVEAGA